jgi:hypothetical protein
MGGRMKRLKRGLVVLTVGCVMALVLGIIGGPAVAVPPHRHCMLTPQGFVEVARGVVEHAPHETAFHQFHNHVHIGRPPTTIIPIFDLNEECP